MSSVPMSSSTGQALRSYAARLTPERRAALQAKLSETVGTVFFGTLLRQAQSSLSADNPLTGGRTGKVFTGMMGTELLTRMSQSGRLAVGEAIAESWLGPAAGTR